MCARMCAHVCWYVLVSVCGYVFVCVYYAHVWLGMVYNNSEHEVYSSAEPDHSHLHETVYY